MKKTIIIGQLLFVLFLLAINWKYLYSRFVGVSWGIAQVDRKKIGLPLIPDKSWTSYPQGAQFPALQFWLNEQDTTLPRHYSKHLRSRKKYGPLVYECDQYLYEEKGDYIKILEIKYVFDRENPWLCYTKEYPTFQGVNMLEWYNYFKVIDTLNLQESIQFLDSLGFENIPYH